MYPIKGCQGFSTFEAKLTSRGLLHDREFMVVKESTGRFVSQRNFPKMCLVKACICDENINLIITNTNTNSKQKPIKIPLNTTGIVKEVTVWGSKCSAYDCGDEVAAWFTEALPIDESPSADNDDNDNDNYNENGNVSLRLVRMLPNQLFMRHTGIGSSSNNSNCNSGSCNIVVMLFFKFE